MSQEQDKLLGHGADNDGIDEYDNPLPRWWLALFIVCIIWGVVYAADYHFLRPTSQAAMYDAELLAAAAQWPTKEVSAAQVAADPAAIAAGEAIYTTNCVACHGANLEGGIGPNLIDDDWIHGGSLEDLVKTITEGVPEKGMVTWGPVLGPEKIAQVAAYVKGKGKN